MISRKQIIDEAITWIGTPWENGQSVKEVGCDCVGFLLGVAKNTGIVPPDYRLKNYHRIPRGTVLIDQLNSVLQPCDLLEPGNIIVLKRMGLISHVGIILDSDTLIHSYDKDGIGVVKSRLSGFTRFIYQVYEVPDLED